MDQDKKESTNGENKKSGWGNAKWLIIIGVLLAIIAVGLGYILRVPQGKIPVTVESFTPKGEITRTTNFTIEFSQDMVDNAAVGIQLDSAPVVFTPTIPGKYRWIAQHRLRFFPDVMLLPSTQYAAEVLPEICVDENAYLKGERKFTFYTQRFRVDNAYFSFNLAEEGEKVAILGTVEFNYPVEVDEVKKHLTVAYEVGRKIPYQIITPQSGLVIELETEPVERWEDDKNIQLRIDQWLLPIDGSLGLAEDCVKTFVLEAREDLKVEGVFVEQQGKYGYLKVRLSSPVALDMAKQHISVDPAIQYQLAASYNYVELRGNFEAGKGYTVSISKGLMGTDGSKLKSDFSTRAVMRNLDPSVGFVGDGIYLSRTGNLNVGLSTINLNKVEIEVQKVYRSNLIHLINTGALQSGYYYLQYLGRQIHREEITIPPQPNEEVVTPINLESYLADERTGIFAIMARNVNERWQRGQRWVMITDLGIMVKRAGDQFLVWVNSLSSLEPVSGAEVTLISQNNQVMEARFTDGDGLAKFRLTDAILEEFSPFLVTAAHEKDLSFVELTRRQISTTDFDVAGQPYLRHGYDAFVYGDRDIYRPGETANVVAIIRGPNATVPPPFPLKMEILGPENRVFDEFRKTINEQGACEFQVELPTYIKTGRYTARVIVGKDSEIGRGSFSVEEFMPDRIKVKVEPDSESYDLGQDVNITVEAVNLFGPPASGRRVEARGDIVSSRFAPSQWRSFTFSDSHKQFKEVSSNLGKATLDEEGRHTFVLKLPKGILPPSSLRGVITATVLEPGGRAVTGYRTIDIHPYSHYAGLRRTKEGYAELDRPTEMEFVVVDQEAQIAPGRQCQVSCYRITWQSILRRSGRQGYRYVSEQQENLTKSFIVTSDEKPSKFTFTPEEYGRYRVEIADMESGASASISFYASGWGYAPWAMDRPERLEIDLDKASYKPGTMAKAQIRSPFSGKLLLTVEGDQVYHHQSLMMDENTATVDIPVSAAYKPNAYISASVIRSTLSLERHAPVRAFGVAPLPVDCSENRLTIALDAPAEMRPLNPLTLSFRVTSSIKSSIKYLTIAAVDEGICQLTNFQTPDPFGDFFGKKRLEVNSYDIYSAVLPEIESATTASTTSGDEARHRKRVSPVSVTRVKPVALWSGLVKTDQNGRGSVTFDVPQFNGSLRIMAVSFSGNRFGSARKDVKVFDPIVLTPTFPRFIAGGDRFQVPVNIFNGTGEADQFTVTLNIEGPVDGDTETRRRGDAGMHLPLSQTVSLDPKAEGQVIFSLKAQKLMGKVTFNLSASGGGEKTVTTTDVPLRPAAPAVTLTGSGVVKPDAETSFTLPGDWIPGTTEFDLTLSSFPATQFAGSLQYLLRYPHGCAEQTTSKLFPLLYFNDMAKLIEPELFGTESVDYFVGEGITKLENMQTASGHFSFWPGNGYSNPWTSIYVSHFLVEARKAGYEVPDRVYKPMLKALEDLVKASLRDYWQRQTKAYACYVLAAAGRPEKSTMFYLKNNELDEMSDFSQFQLAGAFALSGDVNTARSLFPSTVSPQAVERETGRNFNSSTRAKAIMLDVLAEVDPDHPSVPRLIKSLTEEASKHNRWYTTQENAFAFLALGKMMRTQPPGHYMGKVEIDGGHLADFDSSDQQFSGVDWGGKEVTLNIQGTGTCYYYWKAFGIPTSPDIKEFDQELLVRRRYLNKEGHPINYDQFHQGDMVVAEITAKALTESLDNVIIADLLPAGFEIENPRLESRAGIPWIKGGFRPDYMDIRDDRMLLFTNLPRQREQKFYYALRAVTVGEFILPPVAAEAMYDPAKSSVANSGSVTVLK